LTDYTADQLRSCEYDNPYIPRQLSEKKCDIAPLTCPSLNGNLSNEI
jgi:hypothetical protein